MIPLWFKKNILIITKSDSIGLNKLSWQKKGKTTKNARRWTENEHELFAEVLAEPEHNFGIFLEKMALKKSVNNEVLTYQKYF